MGSDPGVDEQTKPEECPQHAVWLPTYAIGKYPVTVAEYAYALEACAPGLTAPNDWEEQAMYLTKPVYGLTWHDALGYAHWLTQVTALPWRLPTEAEWEKAARGTDGRIYPWGNQWKAGNANVLEEENQPLEQSVTPIDAYMHAASPYGVVDTVGNVAEWTSTISDRERFSYPYVATDGREDQVQNSKERFRSLRGGCWLFEPSLTRVASRFSFHVDDRYDWLHGVRLACSEPPHL